MFAKFSVRKPFTVLVAVILVIVLGAVSFSNMTPDLLPEIDLPYIMVMTTYVGATPEEVEDTVTRPMEELLSALDNVESVSSTSSENYSLVTLAFSDDANLEYAALAVREKLTTLSDSWEDQVGTPVILKISPDMIPVNVSAVSYDGMDTVALSSFVEDTLLPSLEGTEGIASVTAAGLVSERVEVQIDSDKIAAINERLAAKVLRELDDKKAELDDSKAELEEQLQKLSDGQDEVANGKDTLSKQQENAAEQLQNAKSELDSQKYALLEAKMQMSTKISELETQIAQLDSSITTYESLQSKIAQAESGLKTAQDAVSSLTALSESLKTLETLKAQKAAAEDALTSLGLSEEDAQNYLAEQSEDYRNLLSAIAQIETAAASSGMSAESIPTALEQATAGVTTAAEALSQLDTVLASQGVTRDTLPAALEQLRTARTAAVSGKSTLEQKLSELENGQSTIDDALNELAAQETSAEQQLSSAMTELIVSEKTLESTRAQLEAGLEELNKGYEQLEDAREDALKAADISDSVTMTMLAQLVGAQDFSMPAGYAGDVMVSVDGSLENEDELSDLLLFELDGVGDVRLSDVATISLLDNSDESYARINDSDGILLSFSKQSDAATADASENLETEMRRLEEKYDGLTFYSLMDQGDYIHLIVDSVLENLILGAALAIVILIFFLKDIRPTFVVACSIPLSVMLAIVLMYFSGVTLNIISLSGLAVGVGMLVDNSIVVIENIYRLRGKNLPPVKAAVKGAQQVTGAIVSSTLTTVCVFLPIVFVQGLTRQLFTDMALTITYSLLASLIVAMTLVPCMAAGTLTKIRTANRGYSRLLDRYEQLLRRSLQYKWAVLLLAFLLLIGSGIWAFSKGFAYMPDMESTEVMVSLQMPEDSTLEDTTSVSNEVIARIRDIDGVETVGAMVGSGIAGALGISGGGTDVTSVSMYVLLDDDAHISMNRLAEEIETRTADLPCTLTASSTSSMSSYASALGGEGVSIVLYSNDLDQLTTEAQKIAAVLETVEGIESVSDGLERSTPALKVQVDRDAAMRQGLTVAQVYMQLATALTESTSAATLRDPAVDVLVLNNIHLSSETLADYELTVNSGSSSVDSTSAGITSSSGETETVRLGDIAEITEGTALASINRSEQRRTLTVTATLAEDSNITKVANAVQDTLDAQYTVPSGLTIEYSGENETINDALTDLLKMLALGILLVYLIMVAQFQSLLSPFIVMFAIPLAFTGGLLALVICGFEISVVSMIGFVILVGIVVNNGIVLVDCINQLREAGMERQDAVMEAGRMRLRPVLMTALTTILGLLPMSLGIGLGVSLVQPVAIAGIGGLAYATLMTLFVIPILYDLFHKKPLKRVDLKELDTIEEDSLAEF